jgi:hypothetical protein
VDNVNFETLANQVRTSTEAVVYQI